MTGTEQLKQWIEASDNIVFFGGAGVSTESGIPDFRSVDGLYHQKYDYPPETILSHTFYMEKTEEFYKFYRDKMLALDAKPNAAHLKLAELEAKGKLKAVVTQNIDGLHQAAGSKNVSQSDANNVLETAGEVTAEATEEVNRFIEFFHDNIPNLISFGVKVVLALIFFFIGSKVIKWIRKVIRKSFERSNVDAGVKQFVDSMIKFSLYVILIFMIATNFGVESSSVAALIASAGVAIGLAVQGSLSNFAGGILILVLKPFTVGDYIIVTQENIEGTVKEIQIFYTKLATIDNQTVVVPNSILTNNSLTNVTARPERKLDLKVGISYEADLRKAKQIVEEKLRDDPSVIQDEEKRVFVDSLGDSAVVIGLRAWVKTDEYWTTRWRILEEIKLTFDEEGIEIPYNQLTVHMKTDEETTKGNGNTLGEN